MAGIKGIIFDIGATLVDGPPIAPAKKIAAILGLKDHKPVSKLIMCRDFENSSDLIGCLSDFFSISVGDEEINEIEYLWQSQFSGCYELANAGMILDELAAEGYAMALVSDIWRPYYEGVKKAIPNIEAITCGQILSFRTGHKKPDIYNFHLALEVLKTAPAETLMVGDTYIHDIKPAIDMGINTVWICRRPEKEAESIEAVKSGLMPEPSCTVESFEQLKTALEIINRILI